MAKFTILGASGFIGAALCSYLLKEGHTVFALNRDDNLPSQPGHVIYAIGLTSDFRSRPFETAEAHVGRLTDLLQQGRFESFLYLSSTRVYQGGDSTEETVRLQVQPNVPGHLYNLTKLTGECLVLNCGLPGTRVVRLSNVVGPVEALRNTFIGDLSREALNGTIHLQTNPTSAKDYIWIDDVLPLLMLISLRGQQRLYNLASGKQLLHEDWVKSIANLTGARVEIRDDAPDSSFPAIDTTRISDEFCTIFRDPRMHIDSIVGSDSTWIGSRSPGRKL